MHKTIRILLVEDDEEDFLLTKAALNKAIDPPPEVEWVSDWDTAVAAIGACACDLYLVDYDLGDRDGLEFVREAAARDCAVPMIIMTGRDDDEIDKEALRAGAVDFLVKNQINPSILGRSIRYAMQRKQVEDRLIQLSRRDALTGLHNRMEFHSRLDEAIAQARRTQQMVAILLFDIDHFKDVNDSMGHAAGDDMLKQISDRLADCARETDTLARLGGDEFAIIANNLADADGATVLARKVLESFIEPFNIDGQQVYGGASVGVTLFPHDDETPERLLKNADLALYQAKRDGRGSYQFYDAEMNTRVQNRKTIEGELHRSLELEQFVLHYQPQVSVADYSLTGVEALVRWNHPEHGLVAPNDFIWVAEATGLIVPLGDWVLRSACRQHLEWQAMGLPPIPIAVNLSAIQFRQRELVDTVKKVVAETGIEPAQLELEITENMVMENVDTVIGTLNELHSAGYRLSIDDFGTGYSSLAYLRQFPVDRLKIDSSFMQNVNDGTDDAAIVKAVINLAHTLSIGVIAEGVETEEQLMFLREHGCEEMQGFFCNPPVTAEEFGDWYRSSQTLMRSAG